MGDDVEFFERLNGAKSVSSFLDALKWDEDGRVVVVSQDHRSKEVLGVAFANREALELTFKTGLMHYYSRSRKKLWKKGEESGHFQRLVDLRVDCDGDALVARVRQVKGNCHLGYFSCFASRFTKGQGGALRMKLVGKKVFDPRKAYGKKR
ncbi:MAG TPA: phosphoribosyl-AMP cyclohydrolase [Planctomycetota bacterium]|nr:phosphoribosyl-AMP cyclohydrolase [Planctomycetota bacterium]